MAFFVDYLALAYHEARNVRHLVKGGHLDKSRYRLLIDSLPTNRNEAWEQLQPLRRKAARANSAQAAEAVFRREFDLSLEDLATVSDNPMWSGTRRGGNRWARIDRVLIELRTAIDQADDKLAAKLFQELPLMCHNTGRLGEKLKLLNSLLR